LSTWHELVRADEFPNGSVGEFVAGDRLVALFNVEGSFYALDGVCPHQGGPLGKGKLTGCVVTCPWHGWQFDVTTGQHQASRSIRHQTFDVKIDEGKVWVSIDPS
jgi:nitrite reductase (NADH) small subunit